MSHSDYVIVYIAGRCTMVTLSIIFPTISDNMILGTIYRSGISTK